MKFTEEQILLQQMVDRFGREQVQPLAAEIDKEERFPYETWEKMADLGLLGVGIPEEYGGSGGGLVEECIVSEGITRYCVSTASSWISHTDLCMSNINRNGTDEQKNRWLPELCSGKKIGGLAMTEPGAGSDVLNMSTRAVKDGDSFILNGTKTFITNGPIGDIFIVYANTTPGAKVKGITAFVVERGLPGFSTGKEFEKLGWHGSPTGELVFEDCRVPSENVLLEVNRGGEVLLSGLNSERLVVAAQSLGLARACLEESIIYAKQREQFGQPIANFQMIQERLARMAVKVEAAKAMIWSQAIEMDEKGPSGMALETAASKLFASETAVENALVATQIFGGYGYTREFPVERYLRDSRVMTIGAGTSEIMCYVIFKQLDKKFGGSA